MGDMDLMRRISCSNKRYAIEKCQVVELFGV